MGNCFSSGPERDILQTQGDYREADRQQNVLRRETIQRPVLIAAPVQRTSQQNLPARDHVIVSGGGQLPQLHSNVTNFINNTGGREQRAIAPSVPQQKLTPATSNFVEKLLKGSKLYCTSSKAYGGEIFIGSLSTHPVILKSFQKYQSKEAENELKILSRLSHPYIAKVFLTIESPGKSYFLISEYVPILNLLSESASAIYDEKSVCRQLVEVIEYLQDNKIAHLDLCPENVMVFITESTMTIKLFNFHAATEITTDYVTHFNAIKFDGFIAPEVLVNNRKYLSSDIYSLGCLLFYIMTKGSKLPELKFFKDKGRIPAMIHMKLNQESTEHILFKDLIQKMLQFAPDARLSLKESLSHPYFWSAKEMAWFIVDIMILLESEWKTSERKLTYFINRSGSRIIHQNWLEHLGEEMKEILNKERESEFDGKSIISLIRIIRNHKCHARSEEINQYLGDNDEDFMEYWNQKFPRLILHLYKSKVDYENCKSPENTDKNNNNAKKNNKANRNTRQNNKRKISHT